MDVSKPKVPQATDAEYIDNAEARLLFNEAYQEHMSGNFDEAIALYARSIDVSPSAPAYTFMAWAHSELQNFGMAIDLCQEAIKIDPDYGNPYNDMGVYLMELGQNDEAIEWLEKAINAPKYECKFFPYFNLGKLYASKNMIKKAIVCFEMSLAIKKDFEPAKEAHEILKKSLN